MAVREVDLGLLTPLPLDALSLYDLPLAGSASADRQVPYLYWIEDASDVRKVIDWSTPTPY